jgi:hypothetical protein
MPSTDRAAIVADGDHLFDGEHPVNTVLASHLIPTGRDRRSPDQARTINLYRLVLDPDGKGSRLSGDPKQLFERRFPVW